MSRSPTVGDDCRGETGVIPTRLAIIGAGYVGLPLAILAASRGYQVTAFDIDTEKIRTLARTRQAAFLGEDESRLLQEVQTLTFSHAESDLEGHDAYLIAVPTPVSRSNLPDLAPLLSAAQSVGRHLCRRALVVVESTVNPGVCEEIVLPALASASGLSPDEFSFAHCPERVNPGDVLWTVRSIPRIVGAADTCSLKRAATLYRSLIDATVLEMGSVKEAEAVKMVENAFRDVNIAFVNELAIAFDRADIDLTRVLSGAATKPFGFLPHDPGCGVGGHCIPVDPYYLIHYGAQNGFVHRFLLAAREVNERMPSYTVEVLEQALRERGRPLEGSTVALLGLAYKRDVPDTRESPALVIRYLLQQRGVTVRTYDPYVMDADATVSLETALKGSDGAIIATGHSMFRALTPADFERAGVSVVVDGRNCLAKDSFHGTAVVYRGIGRGGGERNSVPQPAEESQLTSTKETPARL